MYLYLNRERVEKIFKEIKRQVTIKRCLRELKRHHPDTYFHSLRVAKLSIDIAIENRLPLSAIKMIGKAALLHDYGKHRIPQEILSKASRLTEKEIEIMKEHPRIGMMELRKYISKQVGEIIVCHHEFKASPYPRHRQSGCHDTLINQIVAAADMYDALSFPRAYKKAYPAAKVKNIMTEEFTGRASLIEQLSKRLLNNELVPFLDTG